MSLNTVGAAQRPKVITGVTATGTNQATAFPLAGGLATYEVNTVASGTGVILPIPTIPSEVTIRNADSADTLAVYPQAGGTIDNGSVNASYSLLAGSSVTFWASSGTNWYSQPYGVGGSASLDTIGNVQGDVLYRGASAWQALAPGTSGQALITGGANANPSWGTVAASPAGTTGMVQYNNAGVTGGVSNLLATGGVISLLNTAEGAAPGSPSTGDRWNDSTQHCTATFDGSATNAQCLTNYRTGIIYLQGFATGGTANVAVTATGEQTLIDTSNAVGTVNLPANFLNLKGRTLRCRVYGWISTAAASAGNHFVLFKLGTNYVATTAATALGTSKVNNAFTWDFLVTTKATGGAGVGKIDITGAMTPLAGSTGAAYSAQGFINSTSSTGSSASLSGSPITLDLTAAYTMDFKSNFSASGNTITVTNLAVEVLA